MLPILSRNHKDNLMDTKHSCTHVIEELCKYLDECDVSDDEKIETERRWRTTLCPETLPQQNQTNIILNATKKIFGL